MFLLKQVAKMKHQEFLFKQLPSKSWKEKAEDAIAEEEMLGDGYAAAERIALEPNGNPNYLWLDHEPLGFL